MEEVVIIIPNTSSIEEVNKMAKYKGFKNIEEMLLTEMTRQIEVFREKTLYPKLGGGKWR